MNRLRSICVDCKSQIRDLSIQSHEWILISFASFFCVGALKFLQDPPRLQVYFVGWSVDYNCTTDDPNATVSLLYSKHLGVPYNVIPVRLNRLLLRKQVFTLVKLLASDHGYYKCNATDQSGQTIYWNHSSLLHVLRGL